MKICATADLHGILPYNFQSGYGLGVDSKHDFDVFIIAGDIAPAIRQSTKQEAEWCKRNLYPWLETIPAKYKIFIAGNHDLSWAYRTQPEVQAQLPKDCYYLFDSGITLEGVSFYGTPWQPIFRDWAFNLSNRAQAIRFAKIPHKLDVLITHCPPYGFDGVDKVLRPNRADKNPHDHLGSWALRDAILEKKPKYNLFGHIHTGDHNPYTHIIDDQTITMVNVSYVDEDYSPVYKIFSFEL